MKTKSRSHVEVIQDVNDELTVRGDICFQLGKLIDLYRVALNDWEENSIFCIVKNIFIGVDANEWNDVLSSSGHTQVNKDDNDGINTEDCDKEEEESIDEEENNYD